MSVDYWHGEDQIALDLDEAYMSYKGNEPVIRAYFASPLTNIGDTAKELSLQLRTICATCLETSTAHPFSVYDPATHTPPGTSHSPNEVYCTDHDNTVSSDVVFFFLVAPSTGMGMEAQIATNATLPRVVIHKRGLEVTRMFRGAPSRTIADIEFDNAADLRQLVNDELANIWLEAKRSKFDRQEALSYAQFDRLGHALLKQRIRLGLTLNELSRKTNLSRDWLAHLERSPVSAGNISSPQFLQLASSLQFEVSIGPNIGFSERVEAAPAAHTVAMNKSLDSLAVFASKKGPGLESRILRLWSVYRSECERVGQEALVGREELFPVLSEETWKSRFEEQSLF